MWNIYWGNEPIHMPEVEDRRVQHGRLELSVTSAGCLEFDVYPGHALYKQLLGSVRSKSEVVALRDGEEMFRGRVLSVERDVLVPVAHVTVEGELAYLNDTVVPPRDWSGESGDIKKSNGGMLPKGAMLAEVLASHNRRGPRFEAGTFGVTDYNPNPTAEQDTLYGGIEKPYTTMDLLKLIYGSNVWMRCRRVDGTRYLDIGMRADSGTQELRLGLNLMELAETVDTSELVTAFYPYYSSAYNEVWVKGRQVASHAYVVNLESYTGRVSATGRDLRLSRGHVYDADLVAKYGWIAKPVEFTNSNYRGVLDSATYREAQIALAVQAGQYAYDLFGFSVQSLSLTAVDLTSAGYTGIAPLKAWQKVKVVADDITADMVITSVEYDLDDPSNDRYEFEQAGSYTKRAAAGNIDVLKTASKTDRAIQTAEAAAASAGEKRRVFTSTPAPPYDEGDLWTNTAGDIKVCVAAKAKGESYAAADWANAADWTNDDLASTKNSTFRQDTPPAVAAEGDLWFDTDNGNRRYRYDGDGWVDVADEFVRTTERDAPVYTSGTVWDSVPATSSTFWVPAEAANSLEISIGGALDRTAWPDLYSPIYDPAMPFEAAPTEIRITGCDDGEPKTVTVAVPQPDQTDRDKRLRASYETAASGASALSDELVLSRTQGAYILRRFGVEWPSMRLDEYLDHGGPWLASEYTAVMVTDSISLPYMQVDLPALRPGTWNNAVAPSWATDATGGSGFAFVSTFAHPLELAYYDSPVYDAQGGTTGETERVLAMNSFYDTRYQTNRANLSGMTGEQRATLLNEQMFAAEVADMAWKGWAVYYAASSTSAEVVDINWTWPALPPEPLNENGYYVEVVYPEGAGDSTRRVTARWDSGRTMDETYGMEPLTSSQISDIWNGA